MQDVPITILAQMPAGEAPKPGSARGLGKENTTAEPTRTKFANPTKTAGVGP